MTADDPTADATPATGTERVHPGDRGLRSIHPAGTMLLAITVLSALIGVVAGGGAAWALYERVGPARTVESTLIPVGGGGPGSSQGVTYASLAAAARPGLVTIATRPLTGADLLAGAPGLATGFVVGGDGYVVTSTHALLGATRLRVSFANGSSSDATLAAADTVHGVAVLRVTTFPSDSAIQPLAFADSASLPRAGDVAVAVGSRPLSGLSVVAGTVSAVGLTLLPAGVAPGATCGGDVLGAISIDAVADQQNDGAPVLDGAGHVIGVVTTLQAPGTAGMVALDARSAAALISRLGRGETGGAPTLGVQVSPLDPGIAGAVGAAGGDLVVCLTPGGPGEMAGLRLGDVVTRAGGVAMDAAHPLDAAALGLAPDQRVELSVVRAGQAITVHLVVGAAAPSP